MPTALTLVYSNERATCSCTYTVHVFYISFAFSPVTSVLEKQCAVFYQERIALESTIIQMQHELSRKNIKGLCKATMTEAALHSPSTDCNQSPTKYQPSSKTKLSFPTPQSKVIQPSHSQSKPLLNTSSPTRSRPMHQKKLSSHHQRSHSDGDTLPQQHKQPQWIAKDSERSTNSTTPYVLTVTTPHQTASGRTQKERRGVCRDVQTSSTQTRDLGPHKCAAQSKVKRLEQRLQSVLNKVLSTYSYVNVCTEHYYEEINNLFP